MPRKFFDTFLDAAIKFDPNLIFLRVDQDIASDRNGVSIWNRTAETVMSRLFSDDPTNPFLDIDHREKMRNKKTNIEYTFYKAGTKYQTDLLAHNIEQVKLSKPIAGLQDFFQPGTSLLDIGCGGGAAAVGFAKDNPEMTIKAVDHAFGNEIPMRRTRLKNLQFESVDWNDLPYEDGSFDRILSDEGIGRYGYPEKSAQEVTRIARPGALFRGTIGKQIFGRKGFHESLVERGWDIYRQSNVIIGLYRGPEFSTLD